MAWPLKSAPKFSITIINVYKIKIAVAKFLFSIEKAYFVPSCKASIFFTFRQVSLRLKGIANHILIIKK